MIAVAVGALACQRSTSFSDSSSATQAQGSSTWQHADGGDACRGPLHTGRRYSTLDSFALQRSPCYLLDDLCNIFCIFVSGVVVELASEAGVDYALLQTYIGTGSEVSGFPPIA